jgi:hypothetical protein
MGVTLIIYMSGLLLLAPNQHSGGFPLHVLMPVEGQSGVPLHIAELGWKSLKTDCPSEPGYRWDTNICYFNLDGWSVELGQGGMPNSGVVVPPAGPLDVSYLHPVNPVWFGANPGGSIRSRVSIYSGMALPGCAMVSWKLGNLSDSTSLPNVVTWATAIPGPGLTLTATRLNAGAGAPATVQFKTFPATTHTIELFLRQEPSTPMPMGSEPFTASHLNALYDLLGYGNAPGERLIPNNGHKVRPPCPWGKSSHAPGTPTCLIGTGFP